MYLLAWIVFKLLISRIIPIKLKDKKQCKTSKITVAIYVLFI